MKKKNNDTGVMKVREDTEGDDRVQTNDETMVNRDTKKGRGVAEGERRW